jgi:predicted permease
MERLISDLRFAIRRARNRAGFTFVAILSLALGIGANVAIFSLVNAVLLRRSPLPHAERVAELYESSQYFPYAPFSYPDYVSFKEATKGVVEMVSIAQFTMVPRDMGDRVESITGEMVNGDYFAMLGLRPHLGRLLGAEDDVAAGAHQVVVLSYDYWQRAFGSAPDAVGRELRIGGRSYSIVGVAPEGYHGTIAGIAPDVFVSIQMINQLQPATMDQLQARGNHSGFLKARIAPSATMAQLRQVAARFQSDMQERFPKDWTAGTTLKVVPVSEIAVNPLLDSVIVPAAVALTVVVGLVLLVACANLASFLLAQARDRQREIAIRLAIGANRRLLVRQLLVESLLLSAVGGVAGVFLSRLALDALLSTNLPLPLPIRLDVSLDARILGFAILASLAAGVLFGLVPALQATRLGVIETIKSENTGGGPRRRVTMRSALVVGQVAVSLLLVIIASLFLRSLQARLHVDPGFGQRPAGIVWMTIPTDRYAGPRRDLLLDQIEERLRSIPDVDAVGAIDNLPLNPLNTKNTFVNVEGFEPPKGEPGFAVDMAVADSGFFDAAGVTLLRGRLFSVTDVAKAPHVAIINEEMAKKFWPGQDAVGRTFRTDSGAIRVVGVIRTTKIRSLGEQPRPYLLQPYKQLGDLDLMLVARTRGDADRAAVQMVGALRSLDPSLMIIQAKTMERHIAAMILPAQLGAVAFTLFAGLALSLAVIGVYGVVNYAVSRRVREVGIRVAVGAQPGEVVRLLMREGTNLVAVGGVIGLALGAAVGRALESLLYGVGGIDPVSLFAAPLLLLVVGLVAAFIPARRASRIDPARVLRAD